jgi:predicted small secreted protein
MNSQPSHKLRLLPALALVPMLLAGCATVEEGVAEAVSDTKRAVLTAGEVVGRGDADGFANAELSVTDELNQVCYDVNDVRGLGTITGAGVYRGAKGSNGTLVLRMKQANEGGWKNCVGRSEWLEDRLEKSSGAYYVQISTSEYPNGAIRGQLY